MVRDCEIAETGATYQYFRISCLILSSSSPISEDGLIRLGLVAPLLALLLMDDVLDNAESPESLSVSDTDDDDDDDEEDDLFAGVGFANR